MPIKTRFDQLDTGGGNSGWGSASYLAAAKGRKKTKPSLMDQLVNWLGKESDGVTAFAEARNVGNLFLENGKRGSTQPAAKARRGETAALLPNARIVCVSATAAEVPNVGYTGRLGAWGAKARGFAKQADFIGAIECGGAAEMGLVSRDMNAAGSYLARSLWFDGVTYERLDNDLTPLQAHIYNELAGAWQIVLRNVNEALAAAGQNKVANAKCAALSAF